MAVKTAGVGFLGFVAGVSSERGGHVNALFQSVTSSPALRTHVPLLIDILEDTRSASQSVPSSSSSSSSSSGASASESAPTLPSGSAGSQRGTIVKVVLAAFCFGISVPRALRVAKATLGEHAAVTNGLSVLDSILVSARLVLASTLEHAAARLSRWPATAATPKSQRLSDLEKRVQRLESGSNSEKQEAQPPLDEQQQPPDEHQEAQRAAETPQQQGMNQVHHQHSLSGPLMPSKHSSEEHLESDRSSNEKRAPHHLHTQSSQATLS